MINILILEDEPYTRAFIKKLVLENTFIDNVFDVETSQEAINIVQKYKIHIGLLDIELGDQEYISGLETARIIQKFSSNTNFVFITGYSKYALESFSVHPYDFILKPISIEKLMLTINDLVSRLKHINSNSHNHGRKLIIKNKNETCLIDPAEILFIETTHKHLALHCIDNIYIDRYNTLSDLEKCLDDNFLRVHKSFIVNISKIKKIIDLGNRSFEINFDKTDKIALMSRYKYEKLKDYFTPLS